ncbi:MAG: S1 RNA-binding domain-containing protein [Chloroflexi bacterium]|nr:S1 RNA-binding domain-containing protein [Chloroflexota bacterium]
MAEEPGVGRQLQPTMAELLEESDPLQELRRGDVVEGQIMRVDSDGILVSIGHKSEGVVPLREARSITPDSQARYQIGSTIQVLVLDASHVDGHVLLSIDKARGESSWGVLEELVESGGTVQARITGYNRGGAIVDVDGLQAFIPLSQAIVPPGADHEAAFAGRVGEEITVKVLEVNRRRNRAVLSERAANREQREGVKDQLLDALKEGDTRHGRVTGVSSFGAFVDLGGADGLIHISELSWTPVASVEDVVKPGQEVDVYVLRVDRETRRIALSLRRLEETPWDRAAGQFVVGQLVTGVITKLTDFGAFARIDDAVEGLIHISELTERHIRHPKEVVGVGDTMSLKIVSLDPDRHRLGLSLKQAEEDATPTEYRDPAPEPAPLFDLGALEEVVDNVEEPTGDEDES